MKAYGFTYYKFNIEDIYNALQILCIYSIWWQKRWAPVVLKTNSTKTPGLLPVCLRISQNNNRLLSEDVYSLLVEIKFQSVARWRCQFRRFSSITQTQMDRTSSRHGSYQRIWCDNKTLPVQKFGRGGNKCFPRAP